MGSSRQPRNGATVIVLRPRTLAPSDSPIPAGAMPASGWQRRASSAICATTPSGSREARGSERSARTVPSGSMTLA